MHKIMLSGAFFAAIAIPAAPVAAQSVLPACQSQQELEQVVSSGGDIWPDGCREITVGMLESDGDRLCMIDFSGGGEGVLDQLRDVAVPQSWWVQCESLGLAVR